MEDASDGITGDLQISTDGFQGYKRAVQKAFADRASHGAIRKKYSNAEVSLGYRADFFFSFFGAMDDGIASRKT